MQQEVIFQPFFATILLTMVVWALMYARRLHYLHRNKVDLETVNTAEKAALIIPDRVAFPADNLRNLFEAPVVFYAICLYLYVTENVDQVYLLSAWLFFALRVVHSLIHCTSNNVFRRFIAYFVSAVVLWFMVLRAVFGLTETIRI